VTSQIKLRAALLESEISKKAATVTRHGL